MKWNTIIPESFVDGPGRRACLFLQGCTLACQGCQNRALWPAGGGYTNAPQELAGWLHAANPHRATISGGEPFQQAKELAELVEALRKLNPDYHIIVYTGYTWRELVNRIPGQLVDVLAWINVLVDGRFDFRQADDKVQYRGSRNQRPIDVAATLRERRVVVLDWDQPEIIVTPSGEMLGAAGHWFVQAFATNSTRRCGQTTEVR